MSNCAPGGGFGGGGGGGFGGGGGSLISETKKSAPPARNRNVNWNVIKRSKAELELGANQQARTEKWE